MKRTTLRTRGTTARTAPNRARSTTGAVSVAAALAVVAGLLQFAAGPAVAADGGARHATALELRLDQWVGDGDSIDPADLNALAIAGVRIERVDREKDASDTELAVLAAIEAGADSLSVIGGLGDDEPVIFCGDFNLMPGSKPYGLAVGVLRDAQAARGGHRPVNTFSSTQPFTRLDHIFLSRHFEVQHVAVPRNDLTRVASDHLPLVADLSFAPADVGTPTHT